MTLALSIVMLSMGLTLRIENFSNLFKQPKTVIIAAISQYTIMPLSGWLISIILGLPKWTSAVGLIIVGMLPRRYGQ